MPSDLQVDAHQRCKWWTRRRSKVSNMRPVPNIFLLLPLRQDMAHGHHPNYPERLQAQHRPIFHKASNRGFSKVESFERHRKDVLDDMRLQGVVIKSNTNMRYSTHATTGTLLRALAAMTNPPVPIQARSLGDKCWLKYLGVMTQGLLAVSDRTGSTDMGWETTGMRVSFFSQ